MAECKPVDVYNFLEYMIARPVFMPAVIGRCQKFLPHGFLKEPQSP